MQETLRIAIVGYGIAGIAAAIRFERLGHQITRFERNQVSAGAGAGMLLHPSAQRELDGLGALEHALTCGARLEHIHAMTLTGKTVISVDYPSLADDKYGLGIQRRALHEALCSQDPATDQVLCGHEIVSIEPRLGYLFEKSGLQFGPFDLIVIADGVHSQLRHEIQGVAVTTEKLAPSAALVGLLGDPDGLVGSRLIQIFDGAQHLALWPVGAAHQCGKQECSFAINIPRKDASYFQATDNWQEVAVRLFPEIRQLIENGIDKKNLHVFSYRDVVLRQSNLERAVVIGDAAHAMSPLFGVGAQLALQDARLLAHAIANNENTAEACRQYYKKRAAQLRPFQHASRLLTPLLHSENRMLANVRDIMSSKALGLPLVRRMVRELLV